MQKITLMIGLLSLSITSFSQAPSLWWKLDGTNVASGSSAVGTSNNESLRFVTNGTERMRIAPNGEYFLNGLTGISNGLLGIKDDGLIFKIDYSGNSNDVLHGDGTFGPISITTGWNILNSVLYADLNKNVAIGTNIAPEKLSVHGNILASGSISGTSLNVVDIVTSGKEFKISTSLCMKGIDANTPGSRNELCGMNGDLFIQSEANNTYNTVIAYDNGSKVGIGIIPLEAFHIGVKARFDQDIFTKRIVTNRITSEDSIIYIGDSSILFEHYYNRIGWTNTTVLNHNGNLILPVKGFTIGRGNSIASGNNSIAIGTSVSSTGNNSLVLGSGISTSNLLTNSISNSLMVGFNSNIPTMFVSSGGLNTPGKVGIGTTFIPNGFILGINGKMIVEEVDVRLRADWPWPDYVFENEYKPMNLSEVKEFYSLHNHLPGFKSASEIAEKGSFSLGEITILQQQKIEELTIYAVEQEEKINVLTSKYDELKKQNELMLEKFNELESKLAESSKN